MSCVGINSGARERAKAQLGAEPLDAMQSWGTADLGQPHLLRNHGFIKYSECFICTGPAEVSYIQPLITDYA